MSEEELREKIRSGKDSEVLWLIDVVHVDVNSVDDVRAFPFSHFFLMLLSCG